MSDSDDESAPPDVNGDQVAADQLPNTAGAGGGVGGGAGGGAGGAQAPEHPVWAASAGRGSGSGKNRPESIFAPISMMELELRTRGDLDGASSTASVHEKKDKRPKSGKSHQKKRAKRPHEYEEDDDDDDDDENCNECKDGGPDLAGAAFGGGGLGATGAGSEMSDDDASITSSVKRVAHSRAFPVSGVTCVGCALPAKIQAVSDFIQKNMGSMSELALYKMGALVYTTKVAAPAEEEGVDVPPWHWKEVRAHYQLHSVDPRMQRFENIRTLSSMRKTLEMQLLRRDAETGEQSLDKQNAESIMKIIAASSRELTLLHDATTSKRK